MKNFFTLSILIITAIFFSSIAQAVPGVEPVGGNVALPLTQLSVDQFKQGILGSGSMLVGENTTFAKFLSSGKLGVSMTGSETVDDSAFLDVRGPIRLSALNDPSHPVCSTKDGDLALCRSAEYTYTYGKNCEYDNGGNYVCTNVSNNSFSKHEFKVPTGVNSITVEVYGSGGAGYGLNNQDESPDTYSGCWAGGGVYSCAHGGRSIFYDEDGTTELLRANGGKGSQSPNTGGVNNTYKSITFGGTYIASDSRISGTTSITGSNGGNGGNASSSTTTSITCGGFPVDVTIAATGGIGGTGGKAGNGSNTPSIGGGAGALGLDTMSNADACNGEPTPNYAFIGGVYRSLGFWGEDAFDGVLGAGGAGAGGRGGETDNDRYEVCNVPSGGSKTCSAGAQGFGGGAGGGYTKATISVNEGDIFPMSLAHGGAAYDAAQNVSPCAYSLHGSVCSNGPFSGDGGPGYIKISY